MAKLHDLRGRGAEMSTVIDPDRYGAAQDLCQALRASCSPGIAYGACADTKGSAWPSSNPGRWATHARPAISDCTGMDTQSRIGSKRDPPMRSETVRFTFTLTVLGPKRCSAHFSQKIGVPFGVTKHTKRTN